MLQKLKSKKLIGALITAGLLYFAPELKIAAPVIIDSACAAIGCAE